MMRRFVQILVISTGLVLQQVHVVVSADSSTTQGGSPSTSPSNNKNVIQDASQQQQRSFVTSLAGAGSSKSILGKLLLTRDEASLIWNSVKKTTHWEDALLMALAGWLIVPLVSIPYNNLAHLYDFSYKQSHHHLDGEKTTTADGEEVQVRAIHRHKPFEQSYLYLVASNVQQIARIALVVYAIDILQMICIGMGFEFCKLSAFPHAVAQTAYTLWVADRLSALKKYWIRQYICDHPEQYGRMKIMSRLLSAGLYGLTTFVVLNILKVQMGVAMSSFLALGSAGTLAFGLASKGIMTQIMNGLMLASSNNIYEGDSVRFGNGVAGTIQKMGWMETVLRGEDEITVSIPNTDLIKQKVSNLSRVRYSVVEQTLRFKYKDADNLPALATSIKAEISKACPDLVRDDRSRPFRVYWSDYAPSHLEMMVKCHFRIKPLSEEYWKNRQRVLLAIRRAVNTHEMTFASE